MCCRRLPDIVKYEWPDNAVNWTFLTALLVAVYRNLHRMTVNDVLRYCGAHGLQHITSSLTAVSTDTFTAVNRFICIKQILRYHGASLSGSTHLILAAITQTLKHFTWKEALSDQRLLYQTWMMDQEHQNGEIPLRMLMTTALGLIQVQYGQLWIFHGLTAQFLSISTESSIYECSRLDSQIEPFYYLKKQIRRTRRSSCGWTWLLNNTTFNLHWFYTVYNSIVVSYSLKDFMCHKYFMRQ